jgi:hypothetical protein
MHTGGPPATELMSANGSKQAWQHLKFAQPLPVISHFSSDVPQFTGMSFQHPFLVFSQTLFSSFEGLFLSELLSKRQ